jgi:hypothetical protein
MVVCVCTRASSTGQWIVVQGDATKAYLPGQRQNGEAQRRALAERGSGPEKFAS